MSESVIKNGENGRWTVKTKPAEFSDLARGTPEAQEIQRRYEQEKGQIKTETKELINKEKVIHQSKELIYTILGIDNNIDNNNSLANFTKGVIDGILIGNIELAIEIINTKGKVIIDGFSHLMSADGIKQIIEILKTNIGDLATGNAYERGKASAELVITTLVGAGMFKGVKSLTQIGIKGVKKVIKTSGEVIEKMGKISLTEILQLPKEARIKSIAKLDNLGRTGIVRGIIGRKISEVQEIAVIKAHEVGIDRIGAGVGEYTFDEILAKSRILKEALFTKEEARLLMENGVCGTISQTEKPILWKRVLGIFENEKTVKKIQATETNTGISNFEKNLVNILEMKNGFAENIKLAEGMEWIQRFDKFLTIEYFISGHEIATRITQALEELGKYIIKNKVAILNNPEYSQQVILSLKGLRSRLAYVSENGNQVSPIILRRLGTIAKNELTDATNAIHTKIAPKI